MNTIDQLNQKRNRVAWDRIDPAGPGLHSPKLRGDVGWDLEAAETIHLPPGQATDVPTNVRLWLPDGVWAEIRARSSIARYGLMVEAGTIDTGYRGPLFALVRNLNLPSPGEDPHECTVKIAKGTRVAQVVFHRVCPVWTTEMDTIPTDTERATNGFGSTGP